MPFFVFKVFMKARVIFACSPDFKPEMNLATGWFSEAVCYSPISQDIEQRPS